MKRRFCLALCIGAVIGLGVVWGASISKTIGRFGKSVTFFVGYGNICFELNADYENVGWFSKPSPPFNVSYLWPWWSMRSGRLEFAIPLWIPIAIVGMYPSVVFVGGPCRRRLAVRRKLQEEKNEEKVSGRFS